MLPVFQPTRYACEENPPAGEEPIEWLLLTDMTVNSMEGACEKLQWYPKSFINLLLRVKNSFTYKPLCKKYSGPL